MGVLLELQCINLDDPSTGECYSLNEKGLYESADDTHSDIIRAYKLVQQQAEKAGWRKAKLAQGKKGMLCPHCVVLYEDQTGAALNS